MRSDLFSDDLNFIKNRYKYTIKDGDYDGNNKLNYYFFLGVVINTGLDEKFKKLQQKMETDQRNIDENQKKENKKKLEKLINDFNNIKVKAKATLDYSAHLLIKIEEDYLKNKNKNAVNKYYDKVCRGIMDSAIEQYISYEKSIIIIFDNFKNLCF